MMEEECFVSEVLAMERTLYRVSRSYLKSPEACADAVQEALAKAWEKRATVQSSYFRAWLTRIVINECHNILRKNRRMRPAELAEEAEKPMQGEPECAEELREHLLALPEKLRTPLLLHYLEGFTLEEVARILRLPLGTVKSRMHRARKMLRLEMEKAGEV